MSIGNRKRRMRWYMVQRVRCQATHFMLGTIRGSPDSNARPRTSGKSSLPEIPSSGEGRSDAACPLSVYMGACAGQRSRLSSRGRIGWADCVSDAWFGKPLAFTGFPLMAASQTSWGAGRDSRDSAGCGSGVLAVGAHKYGRIDSQRCTGSSVIEPC